MRPTFVLLALMLGSLAPKLSAAALGELYASVPAPPADVATAMTWVREGHVAAPEVTSLEARIAAERSALAAAGNPAAGSAASTPAVLNAVSAYQAYTAANGADKQPAAVLAGRALWLTRRFDGLRKRSPDPAVQADISAEELTAFRALHTDWKAQRAKLVSNAERALNAAGDPSLLATAEHRAALVQYREAMLAETGVLLGLTRTAVERAAGIREAAPATAAQPKTLWDLMSDQRAKPAS